MDSAVESMETKGVKLLTNYALSLVVSGHSGVRAFLPTFIMSLVACVAPDYVSLSKSMRWLAHPAAVAGTGLLAVGEMVASMVPVIETIFEAAMTFVHPVMGLVNAIGPDLGDAATAYTQGPMAILGGSQALLLHLAKLAIRAAGLGFLGPFIAVIENVGVGVLVPLAVLFGFFACFLAFCVLASVARWLVWTCKEGAKFASGDLEAKQAARWRKTVNACKRGHSVLSIYYIKEADGFKRAPRAGLLLATLLFQLYLVAWFLRTPAEPIFQNIGVALFLVPFRAAATCVVVLERGDDHVLLVELGRDDVVDLLLGLGELGRRRVHLRLVLRERVLHGLVLHLHFFLEGVQTRRDVREVRRLDGF